MTSTNSTTVVAMEAGERIRRFGIECIGSSGGDGIFFQAGKWRPGEVFYRPKVTNRES